MNYPPAHELKPGQLKQIGAWLQSDDYCASSMCLLSIALGNDFVASMRVDYPYDPSDLGRCYRLLDLFNVIQSTCILKEAARLSPQWNALYSNWAELCIFYVQERDQERAPLLYKRMCEVLVNI